jgi:hypothetical protein
MSTAFWLIRRDLRNIPWQDEPTGFDARTEGMAEIELF